VGQGSVALDHRLLRKVISHTVAFLLQCAFVGPRASRFNVIATRWHKRGTGPRMVIEALVAHLEAEKLLGRVREDADPEAAAAMVLGACY
jgi:hypothetical protein